MYRLPQDAALPRKLRPCAGRGYTMAKSRIVTSNACGMAPGHRAFPSAAIWTCHCPWRQAFAVDGYTLNELEAPLKLAVCRTRRWLWCARERSPATLSTASEVLSQRSDPVRPDRTSASTRASMPGPRRKGREAASLPGALAVRLRLAGQRRPGRPAMRIGGRLARTGVHAEGFRGLLR